LIGLQYVAAKPQRSTDRGAIASHRDIDALRERAQVCATTRMRAGWVDLNRALSDGQAS